jgi:hypothetical protein
VSGRVEYLFNECLHTKNCGSRGGYDIQDKINARLRTPGADAIEAVCPECYLFGMGGAIKGIFGLTEYAATNAPSLTGLLFEATAVNSGLKMDAIHSAGSFFRSEALQLGEYSTLVGKDGISRVLVELKQLGGKFEYIYQQAKVGWEMTHQFFKATPPIPK